LHTNNDARSILARDIQRTCEYFARQGARRDPAVITDELWHRYHPDETSLRDQIADYSRAEIAYLSLGGSNALKIVYRLINETGAYRRARLGLLAFMQVDGEHKNSVLHADGLQRKRTPHMAWSQVGSWGAVVNPATGRAMVAVGASGEKRVKLSDWGVDGGHIFYYNRVVLEPHGSHEMIAYLALVESLEEARRYRCLAANK